MAINIKEFMRSLQSEMKNRMKIPKSVVERYKKKIFFMVQTYRTCMETIVPRVIFVDPLGLHSH